jgi:protein-tyrosine-phosphatase
MRPYAISSVLLVCWGNFCRSPMAEAALRAEMRRTGTMAPVLSVGIGQGASARPWTSAPAAKVSCAA